MNTILVLISLCSFLQNQTNSFPPEQETYKNKFKCSKTYKKQLKDWIIWHPPHFPDHSFVLFLQISVKNGRRKMSRSSLFNDRWQSGNLKKNSNIYTLKFSWPLQEFDHKFTSNVCLCIFQYFVGNISIFILFLEYCKTILCNKYLWLSQYSFKLPILDLLFKNETSFFC